MFTSNHDFKSLIHDFTHSKGKNKYLTFSCTVLQILEEYNEAKKGFEEILFNEPRYVPALKGLAEVCLALAKENKVKQFLGRVNYSLQEAMNNLSLAIIERNNMSCLWKLLGDVCYRATLIPEKYSYLNVPSKLLKTDENEGVVCLKRRDLFLLSSRNVFVYQFYHIIHVILMNIFITDVIVVHCQFLHNLLLYGMI